MPFVARSIRPRSASTQLSNSVFFVTGGASGLGEATARLLIQSGASVLVADVNDASGRQLASELGPKARFANVDVSDETSVQKGLAAAAELGTLRGVVNAAGIVLAEKTLGKNGPHPFDAFMRVIRINLGGTFNVIRLAAAAMSTTDPSASGERGVIINTASVAAFDGQIGQAAYSASKGGVVAMTLPLARELARYGIRVMTIAPGIFDTPMLASLPEAARESLGQQVPFPPRLGKPSEYATLVKHIIENEMLNGEVIRLDGAIRMAAK
jgi:NAD(P)-dependent dehydrogenase (short-subunit alcohol dehydrogenase family)